MSWEIVYAKQAMKDAKSLLQVDLNQRHSNCWRFLPATLFKILRPSKSWLVILLVPTRDASIFSTASYGMKFYQRENGSRLAYVDSL